MALVLEQDVVRGLLGGWRTRVAESGTLARHLCFGMARSHLITGNDVVVPQFVADPTYLDRLAGLAGEVGAHHTELVLADDLGSAERRFHARLHDPLRAAHQRVAAEVIEESGGYAHQFDRLARCLAGRRVTEIRSHEGAAEATYRAVLAAL